MRIVSATNRDLIADVKQGRFREDLFYRLHVFPITVPPLRDRPADIPALARHFLALFAAEEGKRIRMIAPEALQLLAAFRWPGNIRQLENAVFRAVVLAEGDSLGVARISADHGQCRGASASPATGHRGNAARNRHTTRLPAWRFSRTARDIAGRHSSGLSADALPLLDTDGEVRPLDEIEAELIRYAITHYRGQMSEVARRLQIGRSTLYRKLEAIGPAQ